MFFRGVTRLLWCCAMISSFTDARLIPSTSPSLAIPTSVPQGPVGDANHTILPAVVSIVSELCQAGFPSCAPSRSSKIVRTSGKYLTTHSPVPFHFPNGNSLLSSFH